MRTAFVDEFASITVTSLPGFSALYRTRIATNGRIIHQESGGGARLSEEPMRVLAKIAKCIKSFAELYQPFVVAPKVSSEYLLPLVHDVQECLAADHLAVGAAHSERDQTCIGFE